MIASSYDLDEVRRIVLEGLRGIPARVYLFGSWATGQNCRTSDIDVAVLPENPLPQGLLGDIREALEESLVVYEVDLVDLSDAAPSFRERVLKEGISWTA
jgi:predicted nucleotidyltransferase